MKKFVTLAVIFCLVFSCFTVTSSAASKKPKKYTKVKTATYLKYKNAYNENASLKAKIAEQNRQISQLKAQNSSVSSLQSQLDATTAELEETKEELSNANSMNSWVWNNIRSLGITYKGKVWTIPETYPEKFMIDGAIYTVVVPQVHQVQEGE